MINLWFINWLKFGKNSFIKVYVIIIDSIDINIDLDKNCVINWFLFVLSVLCIFIFFVCLVDWVMVILMKLKFVIRISNIFKLI